MATTHMHADGFNNGPVVTSFYIWQSACCYKFYVQQGAHRCYHPLLTFVTEARSPGCLNSFSPSLRQSHRFRELPSKVNDGPGMLCNIASPFLFEPMLSQSLSQEFGLPRPHDLKDKISQKMLSF